VKTLRGKEKKCLSVPMNICKANEANTDFDGQEKAFEEH